MRRKSTLASSKGYWWKITLGIFGLLFWQGSTLGPALRKSSIEGLVPDALKESVQAQVQFTIELVESSYAAYDASIHSLQLWWKVAMLLLVPFIVVYRWAVDYLAFFLPMLKPVLAYLGDRMVDLSQVLWNYGNILLEQLVVLLIASWHAFCQQDPWNIFLEVMTPLCIILLKLLNNYIVRRKYKERLIGWWEGIKASTRAKYNNFLDRVKKKSKQLAYFIPHLLLLIPLGLGAYFLPELLSTISHGYILFVVSLLYPLYTSTSSVVSKDLKGCSRSMTYWVVFTVPTFIASAVSYFPFGSKLVSMIPYASELFFVFCLWLQVPWIDGCSIIYAILVPIVDKFVSIIPLPGFLRATPGDASTKGVLGVLVQFVPEEYRDTATSIVFNSGHLLFGFMFFLTPDYFTGLGCLLMGLVIPYYSSIAALVNSKSKHQSEAKSFADIEWWVIYWSIFYSFDTIHGMVTTMLGLEHFPFWYHIKLGIIMYLQLPLFKGALIIFEKIFLPLHSQVMSSVTASPFFRRNTSLQGSVSKDKDSGSEEEETYSEEDEDVKEARRERRRIGGKPPHSFGLAKRKVGSDINSQSTTAPPLSIPTNKVAPLELEPLDDAQ